MLISEAQKAGARLVRACQVLKISVRSYERWKRTGGTQDRRRDAVRKPPANKLTSREKQAIVQTCNLPEYADLSPAQIVPKLADEGQYLASESTFYRTLKEVRQNTKRKKTRSHGSRPLATHVATAPNQVWSWDITWLPGEILGKYYKLYLIVDIFSRYIVQWEIHETESQEHAMSLVRKAVFRYPLQDQPRVLHSDNGSPMKGRNFQSLLGWLGVTKSYSRPRVSNDNAYSESLFKTVKYAKDFPNQGFGSLESARQWVARFVNLYNTEFLHSGIKFVTPYQRHYGLDQEVLKQRKEIYEKARRRNPVRWSGKTRNWDYIPYVALNPVKKEEVAESMRQLP